MFWPQQQFLSTTTLVLAYLLVVPGVVVASFQNVTIRIGYYGTAQTVTTVQQLDVLNALVLLAAQDGINLHFDTVFGGIEQYSQGSYIGLLAQACPLLPTVVNKSDCGKFDMIGNPYIITTDLFAQMDFTPPLLQTFVTGLRYLGSTTPDSTFAEVDRHRGTICANEGTFILASLQQRFPNADYFTCRAMESCVQALKAGTCSLYAAMRQGLYEVLYRDPTLVETKEELFRNFLALPMSYCLDPQIRNYMKRWIYAATADGIVEDVVQKYNPIRTCPLGSSGETCQDFCDPDRGTADRYGTCVCDSVKWTGDDCSIELEEDKGLIPPGQMAVGYLMFAVVAILELGFAIWLSRLRKLPQVSNSRVFFYALILLGGFVSSLTILALMQQAEDDKTTVYCMAIPWTYAIGFSITFGALFTKVFRVYSAQSFHRLASANSKVKTTMTYVFIVLLVDVAILLAWQITDPLKWTRTVTSVDKFGNVLSSVGACRSDNWQLFGVILLSYHILLLAFATYTCYSIRNIPEDISGARSAAVALFSTFQVYLVGIPVAYVVGNDSEASFLLRSSIIWISDLAVLVSTFGVLYLQEDLIQTSIADLSGYIS